MSETVRWSSGQPRRQEARGDGSNLADILERVLDKGIVIAGDVQVNLLDIELLTIKIRLVVASVDRAKEMGIDWWERDPTLSAGRQDLEEENARLRRRVEALERSALGPGDEPSEDELPPEDELADDELSEHDAGAAPADPGDEPPEPDVERAPDGDRGRRPRTRARRPEPAARPSSRRRGGDR